MQSCVFCHGGCMKVSVFFALIAFIFPISLLQAQTTQSSSISLLPITQALATSNVLDGVITGRINIVAGGRKETGTVKVMFRGTDQISEEVNAEYTKYNFVYSDGRAEEMISSRRASFELAETSRSTLFPLPFVGALLADANTSVRALHEQRAANPLVHYQIQTTLPNVRSVKPSKHAQAAPDMITRDLWVDPATNLPVKLAFDRREGFGAASTLAVEVSYANYKNFSGVLVPTEVSVSLNGTAWATIQVQGAMFNQGLSNTEFQIGTATL